MSNIERVRAARQRLQALSALYKATPDAERTAQARAQLREASHDAIDAVRLYLAAEVAA